ncbi:hypothetical protein P12x_003623 [Tundrisphaera lichenicola]|uniref:hypothetical protein n=1 Tax=Tundrisphaera lichenicola TaxID=2029860 RepID=UPI003EBCAF01
MILRFEIIKPVELLKNDKAGSDRQVAQDSVEVGRTSEPVDDCMVAKNRVVSLEEPGIESAEFDGKPIDLRRPDRFQIEVDGINLGPLGRYPRGGIEPEILIERTVDEDCNSGTRTMSSIEAMLGRRRGPDASQHFEDRVQ